MVFKFGRFVIHYKDGTTYMEDRNNKHAWDDRPRKKIIAIAIQPDPHITATQIRPDGGKNIHKRVIIDLPENVRLDPFILKGSYKYDYGFFMDKTAILKAAVPGATPDVINIRIGMVVDKLGHCVCVEYVGDGMPRTYYTSVHSLGMDANSLKMNYNIELEQLPDPGENFFSYPEISPKVLAENKKRRQEILKQKA